MPSLMTLRNAPRSWELDACPHAYEPAGQAQFSGMPGVRWHKDATAPNGRGFYRGDATAVRIVVSTLEGAGVVKVRDETRGYDNTSHLRNADEWMPAPHPDLRLYQCQGAAWCASTLRSTRGALLADEMGIGKSAQAIAAAEALGVESAIVVCPAVVLTHWARQIERWSTQQHYWPPVREALDMPKDDGCCWWLYSYETFARAVAGKSPPHKARWLPLPQDPELIVFDEIHYLMSQRSARSKAAAAWRTAHPDAYAIGLSGTPMNSRPIDLWHPLQILWPGRFGTWYQFAKRYADGHDVEVPNTEIVHFDSSGVSRVDELAARMHPCMLRRTKAEVALQLPPRTRIMIDVEIGATARKALAKAAASISSGSVGDMLANVEEHKIAAACELATDCIAAGSRPLLLTMRKATAHEIGERLACVVATGDDAATEREGMLRDAPCAVATLASVTTGIDLVGFDTVIMVGLDWLPSTLLQGEARVHRIGQQRNVTCYYLIGVGTLDEIIRERVIEKLETFETVIGAGDEGGLRSDLRGGTEDELLAAIVAAVKARTT